MKTILIVDDEQNIRDNFTEYFLYDDNYEIITAGNGHEALDRLKTKSPDLVILDWWLKSHVEGKDVLAYLKQHHPKVPVFVVTAARDSLEDIKALGVTGCFLKPCPEIFEKIKATV